MVLNNSCNSRSTILNIFDCPKTLHLFFTVMVLKYTCIKLLKSKANDRKFISVTTLVLNQLILRLSFFFLGETSTIVGCFCGFVVPGAPEGSTGRLIFVVVFWSSPESNLQPLVYKASDLTTAPLHHGGFQVIMGI